MMYLFEPLPRGLQWTVGYLMGQLLRGLPFGHCSAWAALTVCPEGDEGSTTSWHGHLNTLFTVLTGVSFRSSGLEQAEHACTNLHQAVRLDSRRAVAGARGSSCAIKDEEDADCQQTTKVPKSVIPSIPRAVCQLRDQAGCFPSLINVPRHCLLYLEDCCLTRRNSESRRADVSLSELYY